MLAISGNDSGKHVCKQYNLPHAGGKLFNMLNEMLIFVAQDQLNLVSLDAMLFPSCANKLKCQSLKHPNFGCVGNFLK